MKKRLLTGLVATALAWGTPSHGAECEGGVCLSPDDVAVVRKLAQDHKCRAVNTPKFTLDPVTIVVDQDGRIFADGSGPRPYTLKMDWCNYNLVAVGTVTVVAAKREPPTYGFRFRPKFQAGVLGVDLFRAERASDAIDVGGAVDFAYYKSANVNVYAGFRSFGLGLGWDVTRNFGVMAGYANTWGKWTHNPYVGLYFSFF